MKTDKSKQKQRFATSKKGKLVAVASLVAVIAVSLLANGVYQHIQTNRQFAKDKVRFANTEKDMSDAYSAVVKSLGQPYEVKVTRGCGYGSLKFARGPLSCGIGYKIVYQVTTSRSGDKLTLAVLDKISSEGKFLAGSTIPYDKNTLAGMLSADYKITNEMSCSLEYTSYSASDYNTYIASAEGTQRTAAPEVALYKFICSGGAAKPVYTLDKSTE